MPCGAPMWCSSRSACAGRRSTASATTRGHVRCRHRRGGGGQLGRPDRLRVPRFRGRRLRGLVGVTDLPLVRRRCGGPPGATARSALIVGGGGRHRPSSDLAWTSLRPRRSAAFRRFNYEQITCGRYSAAGRAGHPAVAGAGGALRRPPSAVAAQPPGRPRAGSTDAYPEAVTYVGGMTDRFACAQAVALLGWPGGRPAPRFDVRR